MNLAKTSILSAISTFIKMLSGLVINKFLSIYVGPSGLGIIGQFQNFSQTIMTISKLGLNNGVTKYSAEYNSERKDDELKRLWHTSLTLTILTSSCVGFLLICFSTSLSQVVLKSIEFSYVFKVFGFTIILYAINQLLLSIINGLKKIRLFIQINISQSIYSLVITSVLIYFYGLDGALIAIVTNQSFVFISILITLKLNKLVIFSEFKPLFDKETSTKLSKYLLMALTTALTVPVSRLVVRDYIGENLGWDQAGYWQGMWYISSMYLMVITTALSTYYLPRLSEINNTTELKKEIYSGYKLLIPIVVSMSVIIFFLKDYIVSILFSTDFIPMTELFKWQLIGDVLKIGAWLIAYLMHAKAMYKEFIMTEIISSIMFIVFSIVLLNEFNLVGVTYAYAINYAIYFVMIVFVVKRKFRDEND